MRRAAFVPVAVRALVGVAAAELGYEVTVVKDATPDYSDEEMHAALDVNLPSYASAIVSTGEVVDSISALEDFGARVEHSDSRASAATSIGIHQGI